MGSLTYSPIAFQLFGAILPKTVIISLKKFCLSGARKLLMGLKKSLHLLGGVAMDEMFFLQGLLD